jgi:type II secretory pathway pseudopilin PulG
MVIVFGSLLASAMFHGLLVSGQSNIDRVDAQIQEERTALAQEKLELANLQSPARIAEEARKLGMVPAEQQHWVTPGSTDDPIITGTPAADADDTDADGSTTDPSTTTGSTTDSTGTSTTGSPDELATADGGGSAQ